MSKVYIAGPITGHDDYIVKFNSAEGRIRTRGHEPVNPARNEANDYKGYIDKGLEQLKECDAIYMLRGWELSKGALLERSYAQTVGLTIMYEDCEEPK